MKIHIFYRHYNTDYLEDNGKNRPEWFNYEDSFINLLKTIKGRDVSLNVVFDGVYEDNFIRKYEKNFKLHKIKAGNDLLSFFKTCEIVKNEKINSEDLIYLLENDYLHVNNWVDKVYEICKKDNKFNYISLYDHLDKYIFENYKDLKSKILVTNTHHWRTTPSTCGSFIMTKELFDMDYDIHSSFNGDNQKFLKLNKERNRLVITPVPGLSTHCSYNLLSPTINWKDITNNK